MAYRSLRSARCCEALWSAAVPPLRAPPILRELNWEPVAFVALPSKKPRKHRLQVQDEIFSGVFNPSCCKAAKNTFAWRFAAAPLGSLSARRCLHWLDARWRALYDLKNTYRGAEGAPVLKVRPLNGCRVDAARSPQPPAIRSRMRRNCASSITPLSRSFFRRSNLSTVSWCAF